MSGATRIRYSTDYAASFKTLCIKHGTTANDVEGWDSLSHIKLVVALEKRYKIHFNFFELQKFKNVGERWDNIVKRLATSEN